MRMRRALHSAVFSAFVLFVVVACATTLALRQPLRQRLTASVGSPIASWRWTVYRAYPARSMAGTLLYSGTTGSVLRVSYREFAGPLAGGPSYARPAFTQDLTYDLTASREISFRDILIEIEEATPSQVKYRILRGPSLESLEAAP